MIISKRDLIIALAATSIISGLLYWSAEPGSEVVVKKEMNNDQPTVNWQKIVITEEEEDIFINMIIPRVIIFSEYGLGVKLSQTIIAYVESLKDEFIFSVSTAAEDTGETNTLNIETEILLITPRLISLAFTATERMAGIEQDNDPERTFLVFDLAKGKTMVEDNKLFRDDSAWADAAKIMKTSLLADYQGEPNCDLLFAPKHSGFAASCIGVDRSRGARHLSITGNIPISLIQEFLAPAVLSDIVK